MTISDELRALQLAEDCTDIEAFALSELPADALGRVLSLLSVADIHNLLLASRSLNEALQNDALWQDLCAARWGAVTEPHRWLVPPLPPAMPGTPGRATLPLPQTYRRLYMLLHESGPVVGLWRLVGEGPRGALISFRWTPDGLDGRELEPRAPLSGRVRATSWARVCPARGLTTAVSVDTDAGHATVTVYGAQGSRIARTNSAEAAAMVALPHSLHSQASSSPLGSSPVGSFEHEWLAFMSGNVRSKSRRRSQRGPGGGARADRPAVYHLRRVEALQPTARHPHRGLFVGDYGERGLELLSLSYDFSGKAAALVATKITGDEYIPGGQVSWRCRAAPLRAPLPPLEQQLVAQQEERWLQQQEFLLGEDSDGSDGSSVAGGGLFGPPSPAGVATPSRLARADSAGSVAARSGGGGGGEQPPAGPSGAAAADAAAARRPPQVIAVHEGSGQVAGPGFAHPEWVEGRLLVLDDGSLSFVWLEGLNQLTEMRRLRLRP